MQYIQAQCCADYWNTVYRAPLLVEIFKGVSSVSSDELFFGMGGREVRPRKGLGRHW